jgi:hypothetical protein
LDAITLKHSTLCLCGEEMRKVLDLPKFPLTEVDGVADQEFLFCESCSHGKLKAIIPPEVLYARPSKMGQDKSYLDRFASFVKRYGDFLVVVDIGANDGSLLSRFAGWKVPIDRESGGIENADLSSLKDKRKLILSSHTLEHIERADVAIGQVSAVMGEMDLLAIQVPSLDLLVEDARIDQIHHQHIHYFSERSLTALLAKNGLEVIDCEFNPDHWGALMVVCRKGNGQPRGKKIGGLDLAAAVLSFTSEMAHVTYKLLGRKFVAYGEGQMLPVLSYWLPELVNADFIADDSKGPFNLRDRDVLISAVSSKMTARLLLTKAFEKGARNVFVPFRQL